MVKVTKLQKDSAVTAAILMAFYNGSDAQKTADKVATLEGSRLDWLFKHFERSEVSDMREAVKGMKAQADKEANGDKKAPAYRSAQTRAGEAQALFGAYTFAEWKPDGIGYHAAVEQARGTLKNKGIRWDGNNIPDAIARAVRKDARTTAAVFEAAELAKRRAEAAGKPLTEEQIEEQRERTREAIEKQGARQMAATLYKRKGAEYCAHLVEAIEALQAQEQQEQEQQAPKQAQA
jgi:hypothetical protein